MNGRAKQFHLFQPVYHSLQTHILFVFPHKRFASKRNSIRTLFSWQRHRHDEILPPKMKDKIQNDLIEIRSFFFLSHFVHKWPVDKSSCSFFDTLFKLSLILLRAIQRVKRCLSFNLKKINYADYHRLDFPAKNYFKWHNGLRFGDKFKWAHNSI